MSQMKKRVVALFLALVMCVGMLPSSVFAAEELPEGESVIASEILSETSKKSDAAEEETGDETETDTAPLSFPMTAAPCLTTRR